MDPLRQKANELTQRMFSFPSLSRHKIILGLDVGTNPIAKGFHIGMDPVFEIGVGILKGGEIRVETFRDPTNNNTGEKIVLEELNRWLKKFPPGSTIASYNGQAFDIPILLIRSWHHKVSLDRELGKFKHYDVYQFIKKLRKSGRMRKFKDPQFGLKVMEVFFGFKRTVKTRREGAKYLIQDVQGLLMIVKGLVGG